MIDYNEQSPFHAFADRRVVAFGQPYEPGQGQYLVGRGGRNTLGHFRVSRMRLLEVTPAAALAEISSGQHLSGRFQHETSASGDSTLSFVTEEGEAFLVANDPAGMTVDRRVEVLAYAVQPSPSIRQPHARSLWVICPCSAAALWEWRERRS